MLNFLRNFVAKLNLNPIKVFKSNMVEIKRKYEKPSLKVFELKHQPQLLAGSTGLKDPTWNDIPEE